LTPTTTVLPPSATGGELEEAVAPPEAVLHAPSSIRRDPASAPRMARREVPGERLISRTSQLSIIIPASSRLDDPAATRNGAFYCNPAADQLMNQADSQQATDPAQAAATSGRPTLRIQ
jgi:hypothetical protein